MTIMKGTWRSQMRSDVRLGVGRCQELWADLVLHLISFIRPELRLLVRNSIEIQIFQIILVPQVNDSTFQLLFSVFIPVCLVYVNPR